MMTMAFATTLTQETDDEVVILPSDQEKILSEKVDLSAEHVSSIFGALYHRAIEKK